MQEQPVDFDPGYHGVEVHVRLLIEAADFCDTVRTAVDGCTPICPHFANPPYGSTHLGTVVLRRTVLNLVECSAGLRWHAEQLKSQPPGPGIVALLAESNDLRRVAYRQVSGLANLNIDHVQDFMVQARDRMLQIPSSTFDADYCRVFGRLFGKLKTLFGKLIGGS